jgi:SAM-dependent methyltransferase
MLTSAPREPGPYRALKGIWPACATVAGWLRRHGSKLHFGGFPGTNATSTLCKDVSSGRFLGTHSDGHNAPAEPGATSRSRCAKPARTLVWMTRPRSILIVLGAAAAAAAIVTRLYRRAATGQRVPGGMLVGDARAYDRLSHRILLGSFFGGIAADVGAIAVDGARVLEVGCGPGHLSIRMARQLGLDVTGLDLDPAMIEVARANAERAADDDRREPSFVLGDVAALHFADASFDLVVSTLSMHQWADPRAGLSEIGRVLRPGGRALVWDLRPGLVPLHRHVPDPLAHTHDGPLRVVSATPWRWPWRLPLTQRIELVAADRRRPDRSGARGR